MTGRAGRAGAATVLALVLVVVGTLSACGIPTDSSPRVLADEPTSVPDVPDEGSTPATVFLWSTADEQMEVLVPVERGIVGAATPQKVLSSLLDGTTEEDRDEGYITQIPPGTTGTVTVDDRVATVDMSPEWGALQLPTSIRAYGQVVLTLTQLDDIEAVTFQIDGTPVENAPTVNDTTKPIVTPDDYAALLIEPDDTVPTTTVAGG